MSGSGLQRELTRNRKVEAALHNESLTRQRVERLERELVAVDKREKQGHQMFLDHARMGLWGRLCWLVLGR